MRAVSQNHTEHDRNPPSPTTTEALRDQIFAACGYTFAITALVISLLTPHLSRLALITGIVLAALLIPVNLLGIRRFARLRRPLTTRQVAPPAGRRVPDEARHGLSRH